MTVRAWFRAWRSAETARAMTCGARYGLAWLPLHSYELHPAWISFTERERAEREHDEHWREVIRPVMLGFQATCRPTISGPNRPWPDYLRGPGIMPGDPR